MARARLVIAMTATVALLGAAAVARADSVRGQPTVVETDNLAGVTLDQGQWGPQPVRHSLQWDKKGWSLKLEMTEPVGRDVQGRDVQLGAYYHVTPRLNVGGAVSLGGAPSTPDRSNLPQTQAPRVRLETNFKF
ncbi:MAG TPA: hypothetical protein VKT30_08480 [Caulobacteraceae bacterium]|nr:hypothetical protein [Caulobacteraceae bacterium]